MNGTIDDRNNRIIRNRALININKFDSKIITNYILNLMIVSSTYKFESKKILDSVTCKNSVNINKYVKNTDDPLIKFDFKESYITVSDTIHIYIFGSVNCLNLTSEIFEELFIRLNLKKMYKLNINIIYGCGIDIFKFKYLTFNYCNMWRDIFSGKTSIVYMNNKFNYINNIHIYCDYDKKNVYLYNICTDKIVKYNNIILTSNYDIYCYDIYSQIKIDDHTFILENFTKFSSIIYSYIGLLYVKMPKPIIKIIIQYIMSIPIKIIHLYKNTISSQII